ncbi:MAG: YceI family protein [Bradymonadaceae bacterium]
MRRSGVIAALGLALSILMVGSGCGKSKQASDRTSGQKKAEKEMKTAKGKAEPEKPPALAGTYTVDEPNSSVSFTSIKNGDLGVTGFFTDIGGEVQVDENVTDSSGELTVDLTTLSTGVKVRDKRVLKHFFEVVTGDDKAEGEGKSGESGTVRFTIDELKKIDGAELKKIGNPVRFDAVGEVAIHGTEKKQTFHLEATRLDGDTIRVETFKPYVFSIEAFEMTKPLKKMMEVCGHKDISDAVPIHIELRLTRAE